MLSLYEMVGQRIVEILTERGWKQQYLADRLNVSKQVLGKILHGEKKTTIVEITQIAHVLDVPVSRLLEPVEEIHSTPETEQQDLAVSFMGHASTDAGVKGLEKAFRIIELYLKHDRLRHDDEICNQEFAAPLKKVRTFSPSPIDREL